MIWYCLGTCRELNTLCISCDIHSTRTLFPPTPLLLGPTSIFLDIILPFLLLLDSCNFKHRIPITIKDNDNDMNKMTSRSWNQNDGYGACVIERLDL